MSIELPPRWSLEQLRQRVVGQVLLWVTPSVRERVQALLPWTVTEPGQAAGTVGSAGAWLVVVGGGGLIDEAKAFRAAQPGLKLVAMPSLWGSGAEASPIIVLSRSGKKEIRLAPSARPDAIVYHPELARTVSPQRQRAACGDCWAHALEGFLSPLASPDLRQALAELIRRMLALPLSFDPQWFELSALACAGQAAAGVGLVHGIAHVLEGPLRRQQPERPWHHAQLCSVFLAPVMHLNQAGSNKWGQLLAEYGLPEKEIGAVLRALFDRECYQAALPALRAEWRSILRDPCSRMNSVLVRPDWLEHLEAFASA